MSDDTPPVGQHYEPQTLVDRAVEAAAQAIERTLEEGDARPVQAMVLLVAEGTPASEENATVVTIGIDEPQEVIRVLVTAAKGIAEKMGGDVRVIEMTGPPGAPDPFTPRGEG